MLGQFVDDYTVRVIDVFAMPQSGTGVSVEAVDPVFQTKMLEMLVQVPLSPDLVIQSRLTYMGLTFRLCMPDRCRHVSHPNPDTYECLEQLPSTAHSCRRPLVVQTGRPEMVVGWYHSHPGFGCWLSGVDINTQQSFEALNQRAVAVVVDPIQSVKGKARPPFPQTAAGRHSFKAGVASARYNA